VRIRQLFALLLAVALLAAACGGSDDATSPDDATTEADGAAATDGGDADGSGDADADAPASDEPQVLRLAFTNDMDPPDPDTNYQLQGNQVTTALYEGLLDYAPDSSSEIVGLLAESWDVSDDGLNYTFTLREGLTFSDGSPLDSEALLAGFERRSTESVQSPMGYMLLPVEGYETPDPLTFVINLAYPESAFLTYLASPFSPKAINPAVLAEHPDDAAVEFLQTASAGSGPYVIEEFTLGQQYVLARNENYWGEAPFFDEVEIRIIPDVATQLVQLDGGDLDIVTGLPAATISTFEENDDFQIVTFPVLQKAWIHVNVSRAPTDDQAFRTALRAAIDKEAITSQVWGEYASVSTQMYPVENLPDGLASDVWELDPTLLEGFADVETIELAYSSSRPADQQAVETIQVQLESAGLSVELVPTPDADLFSWMEDPSAAPHLYYEVSYPDSTHPDTWARLFWYNDIASGFGGFLNYLLAGTPESDELLNAGLGAVDPAEVETAFGDSGDLIHEQVGYITIADPLDVFVARADLTGFAHWLPTPLTLQLKTLQAG
jgi:peptide/nickel transport system substrate-binding protein